MSEKVVVEFDVTDREKFIDELQHWDEYTENSCAGFREDAALDLRTPLQLFCNAMEMKLRRNDHKRGWKEQPVEALIRLMKLEVKEFDVAHEFFTVKESRAELVDVANFAMMVWDRLGMLDQDKPIKGE